MSICVRTPYSTKFLIVLCIYAGEDCKLPGSISPSLIASKTSLEEFEVQNCDLVGNIPAEFSRLVNLTSLDLSENELVGRIPTQITQLSKLKEFKVFDNFLTGTIPRFRSLSNLETLDLVSPPSTSHSYYRGQTPSHRLLSPIIGKEPIRD